MKKIVIGLFLSTLVGRVAHGQITNSRENFHEFFTTAGYGAAFGATLGAATLPFKDNPEKHLKSVAVGASLGFIAGSLLGTYVLFSPAIAMGSESAEKAQLSLTPITDSKTLALTGLTGTWTLKRF